MLTTWRQSCHSYINKLTGYTKKNIILNTCLRRNYKKKKDYFIIMVKKGKKVTINIQEVLYNYYQYSRATEIYLKNDRMDSTNQNSY